MNIPVHVCLKVSAPLLGACVSAFVVCVVSVRAGVAQQPKQPAGGTISGHVTCADNDKPARFATVYLKAVKPPDPADDFFTVLMDSSIVNMQQKRLNGGSASSADEADLQAARAAATGFMQHVSDSMLSATVSADGEYAFRNVPPGAYYIHAAAPGYVDTLMEFSDKELASADLVIRKRVAATVSSVAMEGTEQVRENLRLERGAVLSGRVLFDDGSPAAGWSVRAIAKRNAGATGRESILGIDLSQMPFGTRTERVLTDDTGHYRIAGLPTGDFVLEATFATAALDRQPFSPVASSAGSFLSILGGLSDMRALWLAVYSGSAVRMHDAEVFSLHAGEERGGTDMVARVGRARTVSGFVVAQADGHTVNSGEVELIAQNADGSDDVASKLSASVQPDGTFRFDYVPAPATYTLRSVHAGDTTVSSAMKLLGSMIAERKTLRGYAPASTVVSLADEDRTGIRVVVVDLGAVAAAKAAGR